MNADDAALWLSDKQGAMERMLAPLVEINSFTENAEGGRAVGKLILEGFALPGLSAEVRQSLRFADHLLLSTRSLFPDLPGVALLGHLDTVFPPGVFEGYRLDGSLARGPGVLDMKGGLVVVAFALRAISETVGLERLPPLKIAIVADEEVGSPEGQGVIGEFIRGAAASLVFESGRAGDAIITRRKGTGSITVVAHGKAAHAGNNHREGANAIWALAKFIDRAQSLTDYARGVTVNVGKISGGQGKNTVPDRAEALIDLRFVTRVDADGVVEALRLAAREVEKFVQGTRIEVAGGVARLPLERTDASAALLGAYGSCAKMCGLGADEAALIGGGSDASTSGALGIATIDGLGPRGIGFHTKDEQIERATLVPKSQALARYLLSLAR